MLSVHAVSEVAVLFCNVCLLCVVSNSECDNTVDRPSAVKVGSMCD